MNKIYSLLVLLASLLLVFHLKSADGFDMICIKKICREMPCMIEQCNGFCSGAYPRGWGECLKKNTNCCQCNWACG